MSVNETAQQKDTNKTPNLLKSAGLIVVVILLSKIAGFLRDIIVANYYGASIVSDAYFYAYQIPALAIVILGGMGGPFHSATVSVFSKIITDFSTKSTYETKKLFNTFSVTTEGEANIMRAFGIFFRTISTKFDMPCLKSSQVFSY